MSGNLLWHSRFQCFRATQSAYSGRTVFHPRMYWLRSHSPRLRWPTSPLCNKGRIPVLYWQLYFHPPIDRMYSCAQCYCYEQKHNYQHVTGQNQPVPGSIPMRVTVDQVRVVVAGLMRELHCARIQNHLPDCRQA